MPFDVLPRPSATAIRLLNFLMLFGGALTIFLGLKHGGFEAPWYPLDFVMQHPFSSGFFAHRPLFVGVSWLFKLAHPSFSALQCYLGSQVVAILWALWAVRFLVGHFVSEAWGGTVYLVLTAMFVPMFTYFNAYDIALVGFHAACLALLYRQQYFAYLTVYAVGVWNHENILLVMGVAVLWLWVQKQRRLGVAIAAAQIALFLLYRMAVRLWIPGDIAFVTGLHDNLHPFSVWSNEVLLRSARTVFMPFAVAILAFRYCPKFLKVAAVALGAGLATVTMLYGKLIEARQVIAWLAVAAPMAVCMTQAAVAKSDQVKPEREAVGPLCSPAGATAFSEDVAGSELTRS